MLKDYELIEPYLKDIMPNESEAETIFILFLNLIKLSGDFDLEVSRKIKDGKIYPARLNLRFNQNLVNRCSDCLLFLRNVNQLYGVNLDYKNNLSILNEVDCGILRHIYIGIDLREDKSQSRVKIWFDFIDAPELIAEALIRHGYNSEILNLIMKEQILIGFDFYLDGRHTFKIHFWYEDYRTNRLIQIKMKNFFNETVQKVMKASHSFAITFNQQNYEKSIYFEGKDIEKIIQELGPLNLSLNGMKFHGYKPDMISMIYSEIVRGFVSEYNLYYTIRN